MFYYQFNIGDYLKHTAHLTPLEDIAYRRLLDIYYDTETPIPNDIPRVSRRLRVDPETVKLVLDEFFEYTDSGYRNKRADGEIAAYHAFLEKQKANGIKGGRPKTQPTDNPPVSQAEPKITLTTNREPLTENQEPTTNNKETKEKKDAPRLAVMPEGMDEGIWADFQTVRKKKNAPLTITALNGLAEQANKAGLSLEAVLKECVVRNWQSLKADWIKPQGATNGKFNVHAAGRETLARSLVAAGMVRCDPWEIQNVVPDQVHKQLPRPADD